MGTSVRCKDLADSIEMSETGAQSGLAATIFSGSSANGPGGACLVPAAAAAKPTSTYLWIVNTVS